MAGEQGFDPSHLAGVDFKDENDTILTRIEAFESGVVISRFSPKGYLLSSSTILPYEIEWISDIYALRREEINPQTGDSTNV
jgi:hypothetical protein